jgi:cytochrome b subunit of formate dehydrogenase
MKNSYLGILLLLGWLCFNSTVVHAIEPLLVTSDTTNAECLDCHGVEGFSTPKGQFGESPKRPLHVEPEVFAHSVHAKQACTDCHTDIKQIPHKTEQDRSVDCVSCHKEQSIDKAMQNADHYLASIHAQPQKNDPSKPNANCWDCHGKHNIFPVKDTQAQTYRLNTPETCGRCHEKQLKDYTQSIHGAKVKREGNLDAAVCSDCHTAHDINSPKDSKTKLTITKNCGSCHDKEYESYRHTYHGQVATLGYTHTAKCFDCHRHHNTQAIDNVNSKIHINNRLETCQKCHENATKGYLTFQPHGNTHDFEKYPEIWITSKFMIFLVIWVFTFFWIHSAFWFYREYKERKTGKAKIRLDDNGDPAKRQYIRRFTWPWRLAHLILAIAVMVLVLTGTAVLYADSFWAPTVISLLGGAKISAIIHRVAATTFGIIFFGHIIVVLYYLLVTKRHSFKWFGPTSLLPRWQDLYDLLAMSKWFVGKGPRPVFDHWSYWEKFDYWAPFWGMFIIGVSGLMMWFPAFFASFLPGWVFNVATIVHGEEAFLAGIFLFTVHYFNSHFRPDKFPQDTIMFTGSMTLEEFKEERTLEYERLVKEGKLEEYIVGAPSPRMARYSKILGFVLIIAGLILLFLVLAGFLQGF